MTVPVPVVHLARRLLLLPILIVALYVVLVEATASPPADRPAWGGQVAPGASAVDGLSNKPFAHGEARRMR